MLLSIIIPVYNEIRTIAPLLTLVEAVYLPNNAEREILIIDDCSTDGTRRYLEQISNTHNIIFNDKNMGKGYSVRKGLAAARGDFAIIQDADFEYDPNEYIKMLEPLLNGTADAVYGSRFLKQSGQRWLHRFHRLGNRLLTATSNLCTGLQLTDMETCYKMLSRKVISDILPALTSNRYTIEPEITAELAKRGFRVAEVGVSYRGRSYREGKKIGWIDGIATLAAILSYGCFRKKPVSRSDD